VVPESLGNKIIHPYSDFLLHNVGTGDGLCRMAERDRRIGCGRLLCGECGCDQITSYGRALTFDEAIRGHGGEASGV